MIETKADSVTWKQTLTLSHLPNTNSVMFVELYRKDRQLEILDRPKKTFRWKGPGRLWKSVNLLPENVAYTHGQSNKISSNDVWDILPQQLYSCYFLQIIICLGPSNRMYLGSKQFQTNDAALAELKGNFLMQSSRKLYMCSCFNGESESNLMGATWKKEE